MWVARDKNGSLHLFSSKPFRNGLYWISRISNVDINIYLHPNMFPEVKWEDEEPRELILKPIENN